MVDKEQNEKNRSIKGLYKKYGEISVYEYFNYGVDLILEQFKPCEEALKKVRNKEKEWEIKEQELEKEREEREFDLRERLYKIEEQKLDDENIRKRTKEESVGQLERQRSELLAKKRNIELRLDSLHGEESLSGEDETYLRERYNRLLEDYKNGTARGAESAICTPLDSILIQKESLFREKVSDEKRIAVQKEKMNWAASDMALQNIRDIFTQQERSNPDAAVGDARKLIANPDNMEHAAEIHADRSGQDATGKIPLDSLKSVGRGIFCVPMILVRYIMGNVILGGSSPDSKKKEILHWIMDGVSLVLNIVLIYMYAAKGWNVLNSFFGIVPKFAAVGLLVGLAVGILKLKSVPGAVIGVIAGAVGGALTCVLLFVYPVFLLYIFKKKWLFALWLVASVLLYAAKDVYQIVNRKKIEAEAAARMEEIKRRHEKDLEHAKEIVQSYDKAYASALEEKKADIRRMEAELAQKASLLQETDRLLMQKETELWNDYKQYAADRREEKQLVIRQELADLKEQKQALEQDAEVLEQEFRNLEKEFEDKLDEIDREYTDKSNQLKKELEGLAKEAEEKKAESRRRWEEDSKQAEETYKNLLNSLLEQMRTDGFQSLTRDEERGVYGFDYRKAWVRMYYLATSLNGMHPYLGWYSKEMEASHEVLQTMISDASWVPYEQAYILPSRFITGIEQCPMDEEIKEAVAEVMNKWENEVASLGEISYEQRKQLGVEGHAPGKGFYKLRLNEVDKSRQDGDYYPTIFVYDFGDLENNDVRRKGLRNFALRTLCAPALNCYQLNDDKFQIYLMLTDHIGDYTNFEPWKDTYGNNHIYQGDEIKKGLEDIERAGQRTMQSVNNNKGIFAKKREKAWGKESFEVDKLMIVTNMDYKKFSNMKDEVDNVLDITKRDKGSNEWNRSGIYPYFFVDLYRLQNNIRNEEDKAAAQECLRIVKNFTGDIYRLSEIKSEQPEKGFYEWKVVERERLQDVLEHIM